MSSATIQLAAPNISQLVRFGRPLIRVCAGQKFLLAFTFSTYCSTRKRTEKAKMANVVVSNMSFKVGQTLTITGIPNTDSTNFAVNIGNSKDELALHMNPRFDAHGDQRAIVCNSYQDGKWCEEHREGGFPFNQGEEFKILVTFTNAEFEITLSDGSQIHFPNRLGAEKYKYMHFEGDVRIHGIEIK